MEKKRKHNRLVVAGIAAVFVAALAAPASAEISSQDQTVDATLAEVLNFSLSQPAVSGWALAANSLTNSTTAGTATVEGNGLTFTMTVLGESATLSEWNTTTSTYVAGGKALGSPMVVNASDGLTTGSATVGTTATTLIPVGTELLGTNVFNLDFVQPTTFADAALPTGRTYHNKLTYTVTSVI